MSAFVNNISTNMLGGMIVDNVRTELRLYNGSSNRSMPSLDFRGGSGVFDTDT